MQKSDPLIRTKLRPPFVRPGLVPRPRLQARIQEGQHFPLTLVIAPAGFGKTTLVATCVMDCGMPAAWLSLDRGDNQAGHFLAYLIAALQSVDDRIGSEAAQLMAGIQPAPPEAVLTSLINDLDAAAGEMVLVLDDYQFINSPEVHADVVFLLEHCPPNLHLLIATRSDPPLPLARMRARGQTVELRAADLTFNEPEAAQFLNQVMGLHLDEEMVLALEERTEGWVAGLQMVALSMRDREDVRGFILGFSGTNRHILDYLMEEILAHQPAETQRFLLHTSILERLSAPLCDALLADDESLLTGGEDPAPQPGSPSSRQLEYLDRENLFLVSLDDERTWFRYHHLFGDLLKARLHQSQPERVLQLHRRASAWFDQNGFIPEAIQHLLAAHEVDRAADLIERDGPARWAENDLSVMRMADSLPREMLVTRPKIGAYIAWLLINQGFIDKVLPLLYDLAEHLAGADAASEQRWIQTVVLLALAFLTPPHIAPGVYPLPDDERLDEIPASEPILRDAAYILFGMTLARQGDVDRAAEFSLKTIQQENLHRGTAAIPLLVPFLASMYIFQGRLHAAASLCREFIGPIQEKGIRSSTAGNLDVILGNTLFEWNFLEEAERHFRKGLQANEPWRNIMTDAFGMLALIVTLQARGDYAGAMQVVEQFEARLQPDTRPHEFTEPYRTVRVRVQLASGDLQAAADWADQVRLSEDFHRHPEYYQLTLARIRLAQGRYAEVEELLVGNPIQEYGGNRIARQIESKLLLAAALAGQQRLPEAFELIETCLALGEPEEYLRVFFDGGEPARDLLAAYLRTAEPAHKRYAQKLLDAFPVSGGASSAGPQPGRLVEPLSERELEVLQLMALGKTNQEIAGQLVVARGTIKAHAAAIFRKLDVANRTEAVARARELGILG